MKTKYYLRGTILGLCLVPLVAAYLVPLKILLEMLVEPRFLLPIVCGYLVALAVAASADRYLRRQGMIATVLTLVSVFTAGVFFGCLLNLLLSGELRSPPFGIRNETWNWLFKPGFWLMVIGAPCAAVVAILHYSAHWLYGRWRKKRQPEL